jgi:hypothetical protein
MPTDEARGQGIEGAERRFFHPAKGEIIIE